MSEPPDFSNWSCPIPLRDYPAIVMGHGGGGKLSAELVEHLFLPAFRNDALANLGDASIVPLAGQRLAISTDSFVVRPLFFPGGSIGDLAVNGTVNDLAVSGARPLYLTVGMILEEGLPIASLARIANDMAKAAQTAGVQIVTGDTKVVEKGHGDGCYVNTAGVGLVSVDTDIGPTRAKPGDNILVSGTIGDHGTAIMSVREGLEFQTTIRSDTAALNYLIERLLKAGGSAIHVMRDPTRGGVASSLNEISLASNVGVVLEEKAFPVRSEVRAACELLGLDPIFVANEGKVLVFVADSRAAAVLEAMRSDPLGRDSAIIGRVVDQHPGMVVAHTSIGASRVVAMQIGEQLPRIC
jgi:hydrogenase expression/formation protein HypE